MGRFTTFWICSFDQKTFCKDLLKKKKKKTLKRMLKLCLAQKIPLSQFCLINHGFLIKHRKLCLELL